MSAAEGTRRPRWRRRGASLSIAAVFFAACVLFVRFESWTHSALQQARRAGEITLVTRNTPECYTIYRDIPMGFEYDLARQFAESLGLRLKIVTAETWPQMRALLARSPAAFIAADVAATPSRRHQADFSTAYRRGRHVLITQRRRLPLKLNQAGSETTVHLPEGSSAQERLEEMRAEGLALTIQPMPEVADEDLIRMVADGTIAATAANEHAAMLSRHYYPRAVIAEAIGPEEEIGWAVRKGESALLKEIDRFLERVQREGALGELERRYFGGVRELDHGDISAYHRRVQSRLPEIQDLVTAIAEDHGFDWRFISALIYQESHFIPDARGPGGSLGLMQLMPSLVSEAGVSDPLNPEQNVRAGVWHLRRLYDSFASASPSDRLLMALAAYNLGRAHVLDARELARSRGLNPDRWSSLAETLPLLGIQRVYARTKAGFCRGAATIAYINRVLIYFDILRQRERHDELAMALDG